MPKCLNILLKQARYRTMMAEQNEFFRGRPVFLIAKKRLFPFYIIITGGFSSEVWFAQAAADSN
jgi:hypothetical protein